MSTRSLPGQVSSIPDIHSSIPKSILVCTDFSPPACLATEVAGDLARMSNADIRLLYVNESNAATLMNDEVFGDLCLSTSQELRLDTVVKDLAWGGVHVEGILLEGSVKKAILSQVAADECDLVVIGTRGVSGFERLAFGSTAETVLRKSTCPVLIVGPVVHRKARGDDPRPIVFATDFHEPASEAARRAAALANLAHTSLHCVHVLPLHMDSESENPMIPSIMTDALQELTKDKSICDLEPTFTVLYGSEVSHAVVDYARLHDAQMIVLGVRRTMGYVSHLPPQIVYRIIQDAPCPVMTVPSATRTSLALAACI